MFDHFRVWTGLFPGRYGEEVNMVQVSNGPDHPLAVFIATQRGHVQIVAIGQKLRVFAGQYISRFDCTVVTETLSDTVKMTKLTE